MAACSAPRIAAALEVRRRVGMISGWKDGGLSDEGGGTVNAGEVGFQYVLDAAQEVQ